MAILPDMPKPFFSVFIVALFWNYRYDFVFFSLFFFSCPFNIVSFSSFIDSIFALFQCHSNVLCFQFVRILWHSCQWENCRNSASHKTNKRSVRLGIDSQLFQQVDAAILFWKLFRWQVLMAAQTNKSVRKK